MERDSPFNFYSCLSVPSKTDKGLGLGIMYQLNNLSIIIIISSSYFDLVLYSVIASECVKAEHL